VSEGVTSSRWGKGLTGNYGRSIVCALVVRVAKFLGSATLIILLGPSVPLALDEDEVGRSWSHIRDYWHGG